ncbi:MAG: sulfatase-like hydrolase/transferase [Rubrivivax sp.]
MLHQLGNHGPAYFRRVPPAFKRFLPACEQDDLRQCDAAAIVNAYDNALLYTDHVLAQLIARLQGAPGHSTAPCSTFPTTANRSASTACS